MDPSVSCRVTARPPGYGQLLAGQRALVTAADAGLGAGIARALAAAGARLAINHAGAAAATERLVGEIAAAGGQAFGVEADLGSEAEVRAMFAQVSDTFGGLDILVNTAAMRLEHPVRDLSLADWEGALRINLTGQFLCAREAIRRFTEQAQAATGASGNRLDGRSAAGTSAGKILCIAAVHDRPGWAGQGSDAVSKGGALRLVQSLAEELAPYRIRVNAICPGAIRTGTGRPSWATPEAEAALLESIPLGRLGTVEDVSRAAVWLVSDESDYITGATLYVDGGMSLATGARGGRLT